MSPLLASLVRRGAEPGELRQAAHDNGYRSLLDSARDLVRRGVTMTAPPATDRLLEGWGKTPISPMISSRVA